jgi:hypothetical protein
MGKGYNDAQQAAPIMHITSRDYNYSLFMPEIFIFIKRLTTRNISRPKRI